MFLLFSHLSCSDDVDPTGSSIIEESIIDFGTNLSHSLENNDLIKRNLYQANVNQENSEVQKMELSKVLKADLSESALKLVSHYGFEDQELIEMFGSKNLEENKEAVILAALLIFSKGVEGNPLLYMNDVSSVRSAWYSDPIDTSRLAYCAFEALGAELIIDAWYGRAMSRYAVRKALVKALGKVGTRIGLGGLGFALILADVMWCMTR